MKRQFIFVAFALVMLYDATFAQIMPCGSAQPVLFDNNTYSCEIMKQDKCHKVMLVVTGFARASGYGASVASSVSQKGEYVACHILTRSTSTLICQEFYKIAKTKVGEMYQLDLGNPMHIDSVMLAISRRMVKVTVNKHSQVAPYGKKQSKSHTMKEKVPYVIDAVFPIRELSGFCSQSRINYSPNSLVFKKKSGKERVNRRGTGYMLSVYKSAF